MRPTVNGLRPALEVHLLDFNGDLYGELLSVEFLHPLRAERRFENLEALQTQIKLDIAAARDWFASANL
jgi:riboflavin kinase/FMN adenylyltransferase